MYSLRSLHDPRLPLLSISHFDSTYFMVIFIYLFCLVFDIGFRRDGIRIRIRCHYYYIG